MYSIDKAGLDPMSKNYAALTRSVVTALGGVDNITAVAHCMTRSRLVIKDDLQANSATLKTLTGMLGVVRNDNQCQVVIGNTVPRAYHEVVSLLPANMQPVESQIRPRLTLKRTGTGILDALIDIMSPLTPATIGGSILKLLTTILEMTSALVKGSSMLTILTVIGDGAFFFLPLMVAAPTIIKFKTNMSLAIAVAGVSVHPSFINLMTKAAQDERVEFAPIPMTVVKYTYTMIPALVITWYLLYIERWIDCIAPTMTKNLLKLVLIVLIAAPLAIIIIGPTDIQIGGTVSALVYTIYDYLGWLSMAIVDALWPLLVMTNTHRVFTPTIIQTIAETGKEGMVVPSEIGASLSLGGSPLTVAQKIKNPELRQTTLAAAVPAITMGVSEPVPYGVTVRLRRPSTANLISGLICGAVAGMAGLASHSVVAPGLFTSVQLLDPTNPMTIVWVFSVMVLAVVLPSILALILGFEDIPVEGAAAQARKNQAIQPGSVNGVGI